MSQIREEKSLKKNYTIYINKYIAITFATLS